MQPLIKLEAVGHGIGAVFGRALPVAQSFDLARPAEGMANCVRYADLTFLLELGGLNPLGWRFPVSVGLDRLASATDPSATCIGELPDQDFARSVLLPTYLDAVAAHQPTVHRIAAITNNTLLAYRRLTVPLYPNRRPCQATHLLMFTQVDLTVPLINERGRGVASLTFRERQCLSLAANGLLAKQIAAEVGVSEKTVELHLARARHKLNARTTAQAIAIEVAMAMIDR